MIIFLLNLVICHQYTKQKALFQTVQKGFLEEQDTTQLAGIWAKQFQIQIPPDRLKENNQNYIMIAVLETESGDPNLMVSTSKIQKIQGWSSYGMDFNLIKVKQIKNNTIYALVIAFELPTYFKLVSQFYLINQLEIFKFTNNTENQIEIDRKLFQNFTQNLTQNQTEIGQKRIRINIDFKNQIYKKKDINHFTIEARFNYDYKHIGLNQEVDFYVSNSLMPDTGHFLTTGLYITDMGFIFTCFNNKNCFCQQCDYHLLLIGPYKTSWKIITNVYLKNSSNKLRQQNDTFLIDPDGIIKGQSQTFSVSKKDLLQKANQKKSNFIVFKLNIYIRRGYGELNCNKFTQRLDYILIYDIKQFQNLMKCDQLQIKMFPIDYSFTYSLQITNQQKVKIDSNRIISGNLTQKRIFIYKGQTSIFFNSKPAKITITSGKEKLNIQTQGRIQMNCPQKQCQFIIQVQKIKQIKSYNFHIKQLFKLMPLSLQQQHNSIVLANQSHYYQYQYSLDQEIDSFKFTLTSLSGQAIMYSSLFNLYPDQENNTKKSCSCKNMIEWSRKQLAINLNRKVYISVFGKNRCQYLLSVIKIKRNQQLQIHSLKANERQRIYFTKEDKFMYYELIIEKQQNVDEIIIHINHLQGFLSMSYSPYYNDLFTPQLQFKNVNQKTLIIKNEIGINNIKGYLLRIEKKMDNKTAVAQIEFVYNQKQKNIIKLYPNRLGKYHIFPYNPMQFYFKSGITSLSIMCHYCTLTINKKISPLIIQKINIVQQIFQISVQTQQIVGIMNIKYEQNNIPQLQFLGTSFIPNGNYIIKSDKDIFITSHQYEIVQIDDNITFNYNKQKSSLHYYLIQKNQGTKIFLNNSHNWTLLTLSDGYEDLNDKKNTLQKQNLKQNQERYFYVNLEGRVIITMQGRISKLEIFVNQLPFNKCISCKKQRNRYIIQNSKGDQKIIYLKGGQHGAYYTIIFHQNSIQEIFMRPNTPLEMSIKKRQQKKIYLKNSMFQNKYAILIFGDFQKINQNLVIQQQKPEKKVWIQQNLTRQIILTQCEKECVYEMKFKIKNKSPLNQIQLKIQLIKLIKNQIVYPLYHNQLIVDTIQPSTQKKFSFYLDPFKNQSKFIIFLQQLIPQIMVIFKDTDKNSINFNKQHNQLMFTHTNKKVAPQMILTCINKKQKCKYRIMLSQEGFPIQINQNVFYNLNFYPKQTKTIVIQQINKTLLMFMQIDEDDVYNKFNLYINNQKYQIDPNEVFSVVLKQNINKIYHKQNFTVKVSALYNQGQYIYYDTFNKVYSYKSSKQKLTHFIIGNNQNKQYTLFYQLYICDQPIKIQDQILQGHNINYINLNAKSQFTIKKRQKDRYNGKFMLKKNNQQYLQWLQIKANSSKVYINQKNDNNFKMKIQINPIQLKGIQKNTKHRFYVIISNKFEETNSFLYCNQIKQINRNPILYVQQFDGIDPTQKQLFQIQLNEQWNLAENIYVGFYYQINNKYLKPKNPLNNNLKIFYNISTIFNIKQQYKTLQILLFGVIAILGIGLLFVIIKFIIKLKKRKNVFNFYKYNKYQIQSMQSMQLPQS